MYFQRFKAPPIPPPPPRKKKIMPTQQHVFDREMIKQKIDEMLKKDEPMANIYPSKEKDFDFQENIKRHEELTRQFLGAKQIVTEGYKDMFPIDALELQISKLRAEVEALRNKLDLIFDNHILVDGQFKDVKL